jgi:hypothetical protein
MPTLKWIILTFALLASFAQAGQKPPANAATSAAPKLPEQLSMEKWFVGSWTCKGAQHASPHSPAVQFTDKFTFKMALDDLGGFPPHSLIFVE